MMWHTHAAIGASAIWLLLPLLPPDGSVNISVLMAFCLAGALVPDLDASESKAKHIKVAGVEPLVPVAIAINRDFAHRGVLHSRWGWMIWTLLILPLGLGLGGCDHRPVTGLCQPPCRRCLHTVWNSYSLS
jgi:membrane-bound metal-dependent hydrolase YbcI (DUF457 family)